MCSLDPDRRPPAASVRDQLFHMIPQEEREPVSSLAPKLSERIVDFEIQQSDDLQYNQASNSNSTSEYTQVDAEHVPEPTFSNERKTSDERPSEKENLPEESDNSGGGYSCLHEEVDDREKKDTNLAGERPHAATGDQVRNLCSPSRCSVFSLTHDRALFLNSNLVGYICIRGVTVSVW